MVTRHEIQRIKKSVESDFIHRQGITGVGTGYKVVGGKTTDELCIRFYVAEKRDVPAKDRLPAVIDNVKTDVIQMKFVAHPHRVRVADLRAMVDTGTYDPLQGGIGIGPCRAVGGFVFVGTLGLIVVDRATNAHMMLSNFHVMAMDNGWSVGDTICQPSRVDGGSCPADVVGQLQRAVLSGTTAGGTAPGVDAAVASITARGHACSVVDIGDVGGSDAATVGLAVRKRGRTSGLTFGTVNSVDLSVNIDYGDGIGVVTLLDQLGIDVDAAQSSAFGLGGDSGSGVLNSNRRVVGLYYGGNAEEKDAQGNVTLAEGVFGVANPIQAVLDALDVDLCIAKPRKLEKSEPAEIKLLKREKFEIKEFMDIKEFKPERKEVRKEIFKEIREPKDFLEPKDLFEPKDLSDPKGFREPKGFLEPGPFGPGPFGPDPLGPIHERLSQIEQAVGHLTHFIRPDLRPDLAAGALKNEPDAMARGHVAGQAQLQRDHKAAKDAKDAKDTEKGWEGR